MEVEGYRNPPDACSDRLHCSTSVVVSSRFLVKEKEQSMSEKMLPICKTRRSLAECYFARGTSLINWWMFPSVSRNAAIQRSQLGMGAIRRGGAKIWAPRSTSF